MAGEWNIEFDNTFRGQSENVETDFVHCLPSAIASNIGELIMRVIYTRFDRKSNYICLE